MPIRMAHTTCTTTWRNPAHTSSRGPTLLLVFFKYLSLARPFKDTKLGFGLRCPSFETRHIPGVGLFTTAIIGPILWIITQCSRLLLTIVPESILFAPL
ncbi:hypothetical protein BDZ94DRAFT_1278213 [Collybia nuda]|uniref:Uncharacterized protein n=1 Tax=Collybia nuda TaxID=64659 RepID=A0A9P5XR64_9AGAR|nr:hypothetical protein BDZ94DRAFT_1278213 [Collybia nuda]